METLKNENFIFTLTDKDGKRSYGICLRSLFRGEGKRYDVKRRSKHCLCFVTKYPYFQIFKILLLQIHSLTLISKNNHLPARNMLDQIYNKIDVLRDRQIGLLYNISIQPRDNQDMVEALPHLPLLNLQIPLFDQIGSRSNSNDAVILPLLESLGVEKFLLVLTSILNEQRMIFVSTEADVLSTTLLALLSILYPFHWQFLFLPLLPTKLITYTCAPYPYIIGIRRYQLPYLNKESEIGDVIMVDIDQGEITTKGSAVIKDIIGDSNTALKQASETIDMVARTAGGFASKLMKLATSTSSATAANINSDYNSSISTKGGTNNSSSSSSSVSPVNNNSMNMINDSSNNNKNNNNEFAKDVMVTVISDLKSLLNSKPGSLSLTALTRGVLPGALSATSSEGTVYD